MSCTTNFGGMATTCSQLESLMTLPYETRLPNTHFMDAYFRRLIAPVPKPDSPHRTAAAHGRFPHRPSAGSRRPVAMR